MTILSKLSLTDKARVSAVVTPKARVRSKMIEAIDTQIEAATAKSNGEVYIRRAKRWVDDPESGERVLKEVPVRFRPWSWTDENGTREHVEAGHGFRRDDGVSLRQQADAGTELDLAGGRGRE